MVAVAVIVPLGWIDHRLDDAVGRGTAAHRHGDRDCSGLPGSLPRAGLHAVESSLERVPRPLDEAARGLGSDRLDVLARVHLPLLRSGLVTAALLVFTEVMKELPATLLLRPLGFDTLAIASGRSPPESLYEPPRCPRC